MKPLRTLITIICCATLISISSCAQNNEKDKNSYENVDVVALKNNLEEDIIILDVRTPGETNQGYVEGAVIIDFYEDYFLEEVKKLDKEKPIYVYCKVGGRSAQASKMLIENGFKSVFNVDGGFDAWKDANYPQVK